MSNEILYVLLQDFASHEMAYLMEAICSDERQLKPNQKIYQQDCSTIIGSCNRYWRFSRVA